MQNCAWRQTFTPFGNWILNPRQLRISILTRSPNLDAPHPDMYANIWKARQMAEWYALNHQISKKWSVPIGTVNLRNFICRSDRIERTPQYWTSRFWWNVKTRGEFPFVCDVRFVYVHQGFCSCSSVTFLCLHRLISIKKRGIMKQSVQDYWKRRKDCQLIRDEKTAEGCWFFFMNGIWIYLQRKIKSLELSRFFSYRNIILLKFLVMNYISGAANFVFGGLNWIINNGTK